MPFASPGPGPTLDDPLAAIPHIDSDEDDAQDGRQAAAGLPSGGANGGTPSTAHLAVNTRSGSAVAPKSIADLSDRLLAGGVQLPGVHDVTGRPLVLYDAEASEAAKVSSTELASTLCYFMTVGRKDTLGDGVTLLAAVDVLPDCEEGQHRLRTLDEALCLLTTDVKLSSVLLCQARRSAPASESSSPAKSAVRRGVLPLSDEQYHILGDSVAQRNFLTDGALPECCGGSLRHDHAAWVAFYQELEPFLEACQSCGRGLASVMAQLAEQETPASPGASAPSGGVTPEKCNTSTQSLTEADTSDTGSLTGSLSGSLHSEQSALCRADRKSVV